MKKIFTSLLCFGMLGATFAQWSPATMQGKKIRETANVTSYYSLDLGAMRSKLANAQESGRNAKPVIIKLPTLEGKIESFAVYSAPVVVQSLADRYQLGSYAGVGVDDPSKYVRFSVAPNDFQSMMLVDGKYQFIEPQNAEKSVYGVLPKSKKDDSAFKCHGEALLTKDQISKLGVDQNFSNKVTNFSKNSDQKFRTYRLAISVTGEYTQYFGGVDQALAQINATMTRVNGVFEKDFAIRMLLQDFPQLIYTNPATDPYSAANTGAQGAWNGEVQTTLTNVIGNAAYDIGHLFGRSGGGGSAGDIGNVCRDAAASGDSTSKGSAFTSPGGSNPPMGDSFDIDYVAHEMGHQFGAWHTFSHGIHTGGPAHMEPGSGSTIMGYAGITSANVQMNSDPYFHAVSIAEVQTYANSQTCDVNTPIVNTPPTVEAMSNVTIPKGTAFVLTAQATDAEGDPLTYTWEQYDNATTAVTTVTGNNTTGALFRSLLPTTSPTRYFPKLSSVLAGKLTIPADWETVSNVARITNFRVTVRDNNPNVAEQQTQFANQRVVVGTAGPFKVVSTKVFNNAASAFVWDAAGTSAAPYNVANVKIDYTADNGATWTVVSESTPNDGSEELTWTGVPVNSNIKVRVSAIGNVFYAVGNVVVSMMVACDGTPPAALQVSGLTTSQATLTWDPIVDATYVVRYKKVADATWTEVPVGTNTYTITGLEEGTAYEAQVASVCSGTVGTFSASVAINVPVLAYCAMTSSDSTDEYISNVTVTPNGGGVAMSNNSTAGNYTDYSTDATKVITLAKGSTGNKISVTKSWQGNKYNETVNVWIDFNRDGTFAENEKVFTSPANQITPVTGTFTVPADAYSGDKILKMRVVLKYSSPPTSPCTSFTYGEVEDYAVRLIAEPFSINTPENNATGVGPNPITITWDEVPNATAYKVYIGTTPGGSDVVNGETVTAKSALATSYSVDLNPNTQYYTRIEAVTPTGNLMSQEVTFTTDSVLATVNGTKTSLTVFPNPAVDVLNVTKVSNNANYQIFNMAGQVVAKGKIADNKVQVSRLEKGVYVISIEENGNATKVKFIKK